MYFTLFDRLKPTPTLLSLLNELGPFLILCVQFTSTSGRNVYNHLLYLPSFDGVPPALFDPSSVDEWAGVEGFCSSVQSPLKPTLSLQYVETKVSDSAAYRYDHSLQHRLNRPIIRLQGAILLLYANSGAIGKSIF